jgi:hypothetical protein
MLAGAEAATSSRSTHLQFSSFGYTSLKVHKFNASASHPSQSAHRQPVFEPRIFVAALRQADLWLTGRVGRWLWCWRFEIRIHCIGNGALVLPLHDVARAGFQMRVKRTGCRWFTRHCQDPSVAEEEGGAATSSGGTEDGAPPVASTGEREEPSVEGSIGISSMQ